MEHEYHLEMMMSHSYIPLPLVEGELFFSIILHLDPYIRLITRYKLTRTLIPQKLKKSETHVSSLIDGVHCVVISYDLWMSKTTHDIFQ